MPPGPAVTDIASLAFGDFDGDGYTDVFRSNSGQWQFGAAISTILFLINMCAVFVYQVVASRVAGGRV